MDLKKRYISVNIIESLPAMADMRLNQELNYAGIERWQSWLGRRILLLLGIFSVALIFPFTALPLLAQSGMLGTDQLLLDIAELSLPFKFAGGLGLAVVVSGIYISVLYFYVSIRKVNRNNAVDQILPDFLLMISANIRAGMTPFQAFKAAARPEFGPLEIEIKRVATRSLSTDSFTGALKLIETSIDSRLLRMVTKFFEQGLKSGGRIAELLEASASEIRDMQELKRELAISTKTYMIFLAFIVVLGLPMMLSVSTQFLKSFPKMDSGPSLGILSAPALAISPEFVANVGYLCILLTTFSVSLVIGIIGEGKFFYGVRYYPILLAATLISYAVIQSLLGSFLGGMMVG